MQEGVVPVGIVRFHLSCLVGNTLALFRLVRRIVLAVAVVPEAKRQSLRTEL